MEQFVLKLFKGVHMQVLASLKQGSGQQVKSKDFSLGNVPQQKVASQTTASAEYKGVVRLGSAGGMGNC